MKVLNEAINKELRKLDTLLQGNKIPLNVSKNKSLAISTSQKHKCIKSREENLALKFTTMSSKWSLQIKYFGVQIGNSLNWKEHTSTVSTKVSKAIGFLKHDKNFLPQEAMVTHYTGIVEPHFEYCCSVWDCAG